MPKSTVEDNSVDNLKISIETLSLEREELIFDIKDSEYLLSLQEPTAWEGKYAILNEIRRCESNNNYQAQNPRSTASGAYQFINSTWANYKDYPTAKEAPPKIQDEKARILFDTSGIKPWTASRQCWGRNYRQTANLTVNLAMYEGYNPCNCVSFVASKRSVVGGISLAKYHPINFNQPQVGAIIVTYESRSGHLGLVTGYDDHNVYILDANYIRCRVTNRSLPVGSKVIKGYWL